MSINMFKQSQCTIDVDFPVFRLGNPRKATVMATAWDLLEIEYLSVLNSNDFRHSKKKVSLGQFINLYRKYENNHSIAPVLKTTDSNGLFRAIMGMTAEQFQYQNMSWLFEKFNRDYYILCSAKFEHREEIDINAITKEVFGLSADDYIAVLVMIWGLCAQQPEPICAFKKIIDLKDTSVFSEQNVEKVIQYYSCTYKDLRESSIGKQLLYSKPFILTERSKTYIASSLFLVAMTIANGLYWLARDYYQKQKTQRFVNAFGLLFEDYIKDVASLYCNGDEWCVLSTSQKKGADYYFDFGPLRMIVESKSSLLKLDVKQQVPNLSSADMFFSNTIEKSYVQLESSYSELNKNDGIPIIKVILLYDEFSNTAIIEKSMSEIFQKDPLCFVMTIREFEILLYLHCNDKTLFQAFIQEICNCIDCKIPESNIGAILNKLLIYNNPHLKGTQNFFSAHLRRIKEII